MKLKIVYGVDMRLWKHAPFDDKPQPQTYQDLLTYIIKTFEFKDITDFLIKFKDDDDELLTISSLQDFQDAYVSYKQQEKKSLKLYIHDKIKPSIKTQHAQQSQAAQEADDEEKKSVAPDTNQPPIQSKYAQKEGGNDSNNTNEPSPEEINAFLSDDFVIDLLSDLFISVFEALEESSFEISFIECVQGIILSDDGKYDKLTSNKIWPYFCDKLLPKYSSKIEMFVIPMIRNNGINSSMIKQWIPTMLNMMKMHQQRKSDCFGGFGAGFGGFPWRGHHAGRGRGGAHGQGRGGHGHGWRGGRGGWRHHHGNHGNHGNHGHHGWRGRGGRRGWRGHGHGHHGHHGHNAWFHQQNQDNNGSESAQEAQPSAPVMEGVNVNVNDENEQMEQEQFEYTEELVAIMNMGFTNIGKIKKLLNQHKGNKQTVVQELVSAKN